MNNRSTIVYYIRLLVSFVSILIYTMPLANAQQSVFINLGLLEGIEVSAANILGYQVINNGPAINNAKITGTLRYRNSNLNISYEFNTRIDQGINTFSNFDPGRLKWSFSSQALRELFFDYKKLPEGTYQYCVEIQANTQNSELQTVPIDACTYHTVDDIFLINLVEPEDDAKLYEQYPMFSWVVTYPFASELTYRIRVAELKKGQNKAGAISRNRPVYQDNNVLRTGTVYPTLATPLKKYQPYVWAVDAYYKGVLLGGSEAWKFTIIDDSLFLPVSKDIPYVEVNIEHGNAPVLAVGELKLKYIEREHNHSSLHLKLTTDDGKPVPLSDTVWSVGRGDNLVAVPFDENSGMKHLKNYFMYVVTESGKRYTVSFKYVNPYYIKQ